MKWKKSGPNPIFPSDETRTRTSLYTQDAEIRIFTNPDISGLYTENQENEENQKPVIRADGDSSRDWVPF